MTTDQISELQHLAEPLVKYLRENLHPHTAIVVTDDRVAVVEDIAGVPFPISD